MTTMLDRLAYTRHERDILETDEVKLRAERVQLANRALAALGLRSKLTDLEWDEPVRKPVTEGTWRYSQALVGYFEATDYRVTAERLAREANRLAFTHLDQDRSRPPGGLVCSARLGEVAKLL